MRSGTMTQAAPPATTQGAYFADAHVGTKLAHLDHLQPHQHILLTVHVDSRVEEGTAEPQGRVN
jgi:hypothetical protein